MNQQRMLLFDRFTSIATIGRSNTEFSDDRVVGKIELNFSAKLMGRDFRFRVGEMIVVLVIELFLVAAALAYVFHRTLTTPLLRYADDLDKIDASGATMTQASLPSGHEHDELGLVVSRTNELLKRVFDLRASETVAKRELEDSEQRLRSIFNNAAVGIIELDRDNRIIRNNERMAIMLDYDAATLTEMDLNSLVHAEDIDADRELRANLIAEEIANYMVDKRFIRSDGSIMYGNLTVSLIPEHDDRGSLVVVVQDITQNKQQETKIEAQRVALIHREKVAALGSMLAGVAHELNTPLAIVMAQAELLSETTDDEKIKARAEKILKPAERCSRIVRTFLALARQREFEKTSINITDLINEVCELLEYQFRTNDIDVKIDIAQDMPEIFGDSAQVSQFLMNLLVNSQHALMPVPNNRLIQISAEKVNEYRIAITVSDNGSGISTSIQDRVFEPFFTTKPDGQGTGLGLSYCQNVVESHGGTIKVENQHTSGATITVEFPVGSIDAESGNSVDINAVDISKRSNLV